MKDIIYLINKPYKVLGFIMVVVLFYACANITALPGGIKDEIAPQIDSIRSTKNMQINFSGKSFDLVFDEWIQIKDKSQILVSPPLIYNPIITSKGKKIHIEFDEQEELKPSTTYVIQLGGSIKDFTEGNVISGYNHVFSTGNYIDSLEISGQVNDAYTEETLEGISVMLYDSEEDSIVYKERPYYMAITDKTGFFQFANLKPGNFRLIALEDNNLNMMFDPASEKIGFIDTLINIDTIKSSYFISIFQEKPPLLFKSKEHNEDGFITLLFNKKIDTIDLRFSTPTEHHYLLKNDSLLLWYIPDSLSSPSIYIMEDTIKIKYLNKPITTIDYFIPNRNTTIHPQNDYNLRFDQWLETIDTSMIHVKDTSGNNRSFTITIDSISHRELSIKSNWKEGQTYELELLPNALKDFHNNTNDTISTLIKIGELDSYGTIEFSILELDTLYSYQVDLIKGENLIDSYTTNKGDSSYTHTFIKLLEGEYDVIIVEDKDDNGQWSPGNYLSKMQSEKVEKTKTGQLRKNWDLNVEFSFGQNSKKTKDNINNIESIDSTTIDLQK